MNNRPQYKPWRDTPCRTDKDSSEALLESAIATLRQRSMMVFCEERSCHSLLGGQNYSPLFVFFVHTLPMVHCRKSFLGLYLD